MEDKFSMLKESNGTMEHELQKMKQAYHKPEMSNEQFEALKKKMEEAKMMNNKTEINSENSRRNQMKKNMIKFTATAAVFAGVFTALPNISAPIAHAMEKIPVIGQLVEVVTFRNYEYDTDRNMADIEVPEIKVGSTAADSEKQEKLNQTAEEINKEIQEITDRLTAEFEEGLKFEEGYQDVVVKSEVVSTTADYFTLKLNCYQGAGSGYEWNYYYTIDLKTGERLALKDIFRENADYITPISENIKEQMKAQMEADENKVYWLDNEIEEWNFKAITDDTAFYLNEEDHVVICFNEGDVAPMYMGTVEFEIPAEVLSGIRK